MLLATQNLVKSHRGNENEGENEMTPNGDGDKDENVHDKFQDGLLTKHLSKGIDQQLEMFNIDKVNL